MTKQFPCIAVLDMDIRGKTEWAVERIVELTAKHIAVHHPQTLHAHGTGVRYMNAFGWIADNAEVIVLIRHAADLRRLNVVTIPALRQITGGARRLHRSRARVTPVVQ